MVSSSMVLGSMLAPSIRGSFCNDLIFCCGYSFHDALFDEGLPRHDAREKGARY